LDALQQLALQATLPLLLFAELLLLLLGHAAALVLLARWRRHPRSRSASSAVTASADKPLVTLRASIVALRPSYVRTLVALVLFSYSALSSVVLRFLNCIDVGGKGPSAACRCGCSLASLSAVLIAHSLAEHCARHCWLLGRVRLARSCHRAAFSVCSLCKHTGRYSVLWTAPEVDCDSERYRSAHRVLVALAVFPVGVRPACFRMILG
jgi:hypothetical protein